MTLEGEVVLGVGRVDVLDSHPALHAAEGEPGGSVLLVPEDGDAAVLVLEGRLHLLVLLGLAIQLVDNDASAGSPHYGHGIVHISAVRPLR